MRLASPFPFWSIFTAIFSSRASTTRRVPCKHTGGFYQDSIGDVYCRSCHADLT
jgi:hypothetical protein